MEKKEPSRRKRAQPIAAARFKLARHILVAEDDIYALELNLRALAKAGYKVAAANDGEAAWAALDVFHYDLVVTDNCMPKMSGIELLEKMRVAHLATPVIMATGALPEAEFAAKPWLEPAAILLKPYTSEGLVAVVEKVLHATDALREDIMRRARSTRKRSAKSSPALSASSLSIGE